MRYYAGIGSRETPEFVCSVMSDIARFLAYNGYILRSGHAKGADQAFESGCDRAKGNKEIYLPWKGFEGSDSPYFNQSQLAFDMAKKYHPRWDGLSQGARHMHARNCYQVFGIDLDRPVDFVVCWTDGGKGSGGTGQVLRIAKSGCIPILDLGVYEHKYAMIEAFRKL